MPLIPNLSRLSQNFGQGQPGLHSASLTSNKRREKRKEREGRRSKENGRKEQKEDKVTQNCFLGLNMSFNVVLA
jgi:hypothetical protein